MPPSLPLIEIQCPVSRGFCSKTRKEVTKYLTWFLQVRRKNVGKQNQIILDENVDKQSQNMY